MFNICNVNFTLRLQMTRVKGAKPQLTVRTLFTSDQDYHLKNLRTEWRKIKSYVMTSDTSILINSVFHQTSGPLW